MDVEKLFGVYGGVILLFGDVRSLKICTKNCTMIYDCCVAFVHAMCKDMVRFRCFFSRRCGASTLDGRWMGTCPMDLRLRLRSLCRGFREWGLSPSRDAGHSDCSCRWDMMGCRVKVHNFAWCPVLMIIVPDKGRYTCFPLLCVLFLNAELFCFKTNREGYQGCGVGWCYYVTVAYSCTVPVPNSEAECRGGVLTPAYAFHGTNWIDRVQAASWRKFCAAPQLLAVRCRC